MSNGETVSTARHGGRTWLVVVLAILLVVGATFGWFFFQSRQKVLNLLQVNALQTQRLEEYGRLSDQVSQFNVRFGERFGRIRTLEGVESILGDIDRMRAQGLPGEVDSLVAEFRATAEKVEWLGDQMEKLEGSLGAPAVVKVGDTHSEIVLNYLKTGAGLPPDEAKAVLNHTALIWELEPGNRVYNLYWNGVFLTTVTQGEAPRSPLIVQQRMREATRQRIEELEMILQQTMPDTLTTGMP